MGLIDLFEINCLRFSCLFSYFVAFSVYFCLFEGSLSFFSFLMFVWLGHFL